MLLGQGAGGFVQRDHRFTCSVVGVEALDNIVEGRRRPGRQKQPVVVFENGTLALRHETRGRLRQLLRIKRLGGVGGVGLAQRIRPVVKPSVRVGVNVRVVAVGQEIPADVVHGQREITASVVDVALCASNPMHTIIGDHLRPPCCGGPREGHAHVGHQRTTWKRDRGPHVGVRSLEQRNVLNGTVAEFVHVARSSCRFGLGRKQSSHGAERREDHHGYEQEEHGSRAEVLLFATLHVFQHASCII